MRKLIALAAAATLVAGLTACSGGDAEENDVGTTKVVEYRVNSKVITRLSDGSIIPSGFAPIGAIAYTGAMGLTQQATDVPFPYTSPTDAPIVLEPGSTATITATTPLDGWIECTISIDGKVVVIERSPEADAPTVTCSTTV